MARKTFIPLVLVTILLCKVSLTVSSEIQAADSDNHSAASSTVGKDDSFCTVGKDASTTCTVDGGPTMMDSDLGE